MLTDTSASDFTRHSLAAASGRWSVDAARSRVTFTVRHMLVANVRGRFTEFGGALEFAADGTVTARGTVEAASIDTGEPVRDERLRHAAEFFDVERFTEISYVSRQITFADQRIVIVGELTLRGVTRELELGGEVSGPVRDGAGTTRITLCLQGVLERSQFGITWNETVDRGGVLLADRVKVRLDISATSSDQGGRSG